MGIIIDDGTGDGPSARVNALHELFTRTVVETEQERATDIGDSYNINTDTIALTGTGASAVLYLKNDEDQTMVVTAMVIGIGSVSATITDSVFVKMIRNPTTGTIISDANAIAMKGNRNFGQNKTLKDTTLVFSASATGKTVTDGDDFALFYMDGNERLFAPLDVELEKGSSVAVTIDLNTSGGGSAYAAFIVHIKDPKAQ